MNDTMSDVRLRIVARYGRRKMHCMTDAKALCKYGVSKGITVDCEKKLNGSVWVFESKHSIEFLTEKFASVSSGNGEPRGDKIPPGAVLMIL
jgi:hypothetical protein